MKVLVAFLVLASFAAAFGMASVGKGEPVSYLSVDPILPTEEKRGYAVSVSPASGPAGTTITVSYSVSSPAASTWIGVFPAGSYTTSLFRMPLPNQAGSITFSTATLTPGSYNIYLTYQYIQATATYTVGSGSSSSGGSGLTTGSTSTGTTGTSATTSSSTSAVTTGSGTAASTWVNLHNTRRNGIVPPLSWDTKLAASAQNWANTMASKCSMYHSGTYGLGENIAYGYANSAAVMVGWADDEKPNYNPATATCTGTCGHYTQVMWRLTTLVGCGVAYCGATPYYCCQYIRPGNCNGYNFMSTSSPCPYFDDSSL